MNVSVIPNRVYTHYKGGAYTVLSVVKDATNAREGNEVVVYVSNADGKTYCRDIAEFTERIRLPDGSLGSRFAPAE